MRVIAGKFRSRRLKGPKSLRLRPTSDRLRETLFNILGPSAKGSLFVDLFAGTGAIGIEAISRGARETVFAESHAAAARLIRENLASLGVREGADVMECDALRALEILSSRHMLPDFIFLDPPYAKSDEHLRILNFLDSSPLISSHGVVIVEHHRNAFLPERLEHLERIRLLEQGDTSLSFYRLAAAA